MSEGQAAWAPLKHRYEAALVAAGAAAVHFHLQSRELYETLSHLIEADELKKYTETFAAYDRDGGGEVDSLELGVMFRKLGHAVPDEAVFAMLDSVDIDESGTMSLEEFCLLMLRYKRGAAMPAWLRVLFVAEDEGARP